MGQETTDESSTENQPNTLTMTAPTNFDARFGQDTPIGRVRDFILSAQNQGEGWENSWKNDLSPWDAGAPQPALTSTLLHNDDQLIPKTGRALVAGCGRGYDVMCLAERGMKAVGVDISETAVAKAREWLASQPESQARLRSSFSVADFFQLGLDGNNGDSVVGDGFEMAYDYTFFCAIPPALRSSWASTYARIVKPDGILFTLVYPIHGDRVGGPPYSVHPDIYTALLEDNFELIHRGVPKEQKDTHVGVEEVMLWRRKKAAKI